MNISYREQTARYFSNHQSVVAGLILFLFAFSVFAANAVLNQPGVHPQPIWGMNKTAANNPVIPARKTKVPVRRVETSSYSAAGIPVPVQRPQLHSSKNEHANRTDDGTVKVDVTRAQHLLEKLGYYSGTEDGLVGPQTKLSVESFQRKKSLRVTGIITPALLQLLENAVISQPRTQVTPPARDPNISMATNIDPSLITRTQVGLINFGSRDVSINGVMGLNTKLAIEKFQKRFKLEVNGVPNMELIRKMESVGALTRG